MATLRKQLQDELRKRIGDHADLPVREIAEVPEVKELLEALYPTRVAARLWHRHVVRQMVASDVAADGTRSWVSVTQPELAVETDAEGESVPLMHREQVYVTADEARTDPGFRASGLHDLHKRILGLVRRSPLLDADTKGRLMEQIDRAFDLAA